MCHFRTRSRPAAPDICAACALLWYVLVLSVPIAPAAQHEQHSTSSTAPAAQRQQHSTLARVGCWSRCLLPQMLLVHRHRHAHTHKISHTHTHTHTLWFAACPTLRANAPLPLALGPCTLHDCVCVHAITTCSDGPSEGDLHHEPQRFLRNVQGKCGMAAQLQCLLLIGVHACDPSLCGPSEHRLASNFRMPRT